MLRFISLAEALTAKILDVVEAGRIELLSEETNDRHRDDSEISSANSSIPGEEESWHKLPLDTAHLLNFQHYKDGGASISSKPIAGR